MRGLNGCQRALKSEDGCHRLVDRRVADRPADHRGAGIPSVPRALRAGLVVRRERRLRSGIQGHRSRGTRIPPAPNRSSRGTFDGDLQSLDEVDVELHGTTFQQGVWTALRDVRVGTTSTYADLAKRVGSPSAVRAVGAANGANPVAVVLPCHRIIGTNGSLTGYGGGLQRKRWLLDHEGVTRGLF